MTDIVSYEPEKSDAFTNILRFYESGDVALKAEEEAILARWNHCNALIRQRKFKSEQIVQMLVDQFKVSKYTAQNDIKQTYALFGRIYTISKRYVIAHAIENLIIRIAQWEVDKSLAPLVPKLYDTLAKFTAQLEEELAKKDVPASTIVFSVVQGQEVKTMSFDDAKALLKLRKEKPNTYDDYEDVK